MSFLEIVKVVIAAATILTGLVSLLRPRAVQGFTGLTAPGARGLAEIRAILGGAFIGLGLAPLILGFGQAYQMLGITYLVIAAARVVGLVVDGSTEGSNLISLAVEVVFGVVLLL
ncbi:MAG: DUF4345 family protein [Anaerolineae bacterium]|jgi:hypothetical protein